MLCWCSGDARPRTRQGLHLLLSTACTWGSGSQVCPTNPSLTVTWECFFQEHQGLPEGPVFSRQTSHLVMRWAGESYESCRIQRSCPGGALRGQCQEQPDVRRLGGLRWQALDFKSPLFLKLGNLQKHSVRAGLEDLTHINGIWNQPQTQAQLPLCGHAWSQVCGRWD